MSFSLISPCDPEKMDLDRQTGGQQNGTIMGPFFFLRYGTLKMLNKLRLLQKHSNNFMKANVH